MRNFKEFIDKNIAVSFDSEKELKTFLELCDKHGLKGNCNQSAMEMFSLDKVSLFLSYAIPLNVGLSYSSSAFAKEYYKTLKASEFLTQTTTVIEIFQSNQTVVCLKKQDGKVIARGVARCSKDDEFKFDYGSTIAFKRMLVDSKNKELMKDFVMPKSNHIYGDAVDALLPKIKTLKDGTKIIKQDCYEVGDLVVLKKSKIPRNYKRICTISNVCEHFGEISYAFSFIKDDNTKFKSNMWWHQHRIKGKVIE